MILYNFPLKILKQGKLSSSATAYSNLGAPARDYKPAPVEERIIATIVIYLEGQEPSAAIRYSPV